jgi:hypothetical protein
MQLADVAQTSAQSYRQVGERHGWRKGRNSSRGYDGLTIPLDTWDDRPHERYLALVDHHLSSAADHLDACAACVRTEKPTAAFTLARETFVASSKAGWLLDDTASWMQRAARAHLELRADVDDYARRLPRRIESGHPNFERRRWKEVRSHWDADVIAPLFGKRALTGKRHEATLIGEPLLTSSELRARFVSLVDARSDHSRPGPRGDALIVDPRDASPSGAGVQFGKANVDAAPAVVVATDAWLHSLGAWLRYNAWDDSEVVSLRRHLPLA